MKQYRAPIFLAIAMISIALLAVVDIVPQEVAQYAPLVLLVLFPNAWLRRGSCNFAKRGQA